VNSNSDKNPSGITKSISTVNPQNPYKLLNKYLINLEREAHKQKQNLESIKKHKNPKNKSNSNVESFEDEINNPVKKPRRFSLSNKNNNLSINSNRSNLNKNISDVKAPQFKIERRHSHFRDRYFSPIITLKNIHSANLFQFPLHRNFSLKNKLIRHFNNSVSEISAEDETVIAKEKSMRIRYSDLSFNFKDKNYFNGSCDGNSILNCESNIFSNKDSNKQHLAFIDNHENIYDDKNASLLHNLDEFAKRYGTLKNDVGVEMSKFIKIMLKELTFLIIWIAKIHQR
jgi:hypothetical protein